MEVKVLNKLVFRTIVVVIIIGILLVYKTAKLEVSQEFLKISSNSIIITIIITKRPLRKHQGDTSP